LNIEYRARSDEGRMKRKQKEEEVFLPSKFKHLVLPLRAFIHTYNELTAYLRTLRNVRGPNNDYRRL